MTGMIRIRSIGAWVVLAILWLLLSGHYTPLLLGLGAASVLFVAWLAERMGLTPRVDVVRILPGALLYGPYLLWQIVRASIDVARRVLHPRLPIAPRIVEVRAGQRSDALRVVYANSITLTPGTVTVELKGDRVRVHALTGEGAEGLAEGDLDRHVSAVERR